jgi:hypothetical protein
MVALKKEAPIFLWSPPRHTDLHPTGSGTASHQPRPWRTVPLVPSQGSRSQGLAGTYKLSSPSVWGFCWNTLVGELWLTHGLIEGSN